ncbi:hypothetical protein [Asticcacaulis solisilvae]|uniref:hypothetical protein n=1 Tax=Asticcacaulis solisilvae TaxID=1217274 RepID=UPI003FD6E648
MKFITAISALALAFATPVAAADPSGAWVLKSGEGTPIYRFVIGRTAKGWEAIWVRPETLRTDGANFFKMKDAVVRRPAMTVVEKGGGLELTFDDPEPHSRPDVFDITPVDAGHATESYVNFNVGAVTLVREAEGTAADHWDPAKTYAAQTIRSDNAEMSAIFKADQDARKNGMAGDWAKIGADDAQRRQQTAELLKAGALQSGDDFLHAAFVFQHGSTPEDYMLAHVLATVAVARGQGEATWIAAATLDRYLMAEKQPQIFGTQFGKQNGQDWTQEPYNRTPCARTWAFR